MNKKYDELMINNEYSILKTLQKMDEVKRKLLIVNSLDGKYWNLISIGDLQRAIISGTELIKKINTIHISDKQVANTTQSHDVLKKRMESMRCEFMPVLDQFNNLESVLFWEDFFKEKKSISHSKLSCPVVIMAGGQGTRLKPISNVIPKPLTPIGESTIIEEIMSRFNDAGCNRFLLTVNYKKEMIQYYLDKEAKHSSEIEYFVEDKPLGTAGSITLLKNKINSTFFVSNCDILIDQDLQELYDYHKNNNNEITLVAALKNVKISYGTLISGDDGLLESMEEKPDLTFKINAGVYILEPHLIDEIPDNEFYHITDLIDKVKARNGRVGVFPISEQSWLDIGEWPEYINTVKALSSDKNFVGL